MNSERFSEHVAACASVQPPKLRKTFKGEFIMSRSAFKNFLCEYRLQNASCKDITWMFGRKGVILTELLQYLLRALGSIKTQMCLTMHFKKHLPGEVMSEKFYTCTQMKTLMNSRTIHEVLTEWHRELEEKLDQFVQRGSGWQLDKIDQVEIRAGKYVPCVGGCLVELPGWIKKKRATVSVETTTDCFMYSVLAGLHPSSTNKKRTNQYLGYITLYDFSDVRGVVSIKDIEKFERKNNISVNVYTLNFSSQNSDLVQSQETDEIDGEVLNLSHEKNRTIVPLKVSTQEKNKHVDLLLIDEH